mgnify:FL=1
MVDDILTQDVYIRNELGLHARPAALLAQEAARFKSQIRLVSPETEVDAKSVLDILSLAASKGQTLTLKVSGDDAHEALESLLGFFQDGFREN